MRFLEEVAVSENPILAHRLVTPFERNCLLIDALIAEAKQLWPMPALYRSQLSLLTRELILSPGRSRVPVRIRMIACYILHTDDFGLSLPRIGRMLGRDHTTILWAERMVIARLADDPQLGEFVRRALIRYESVVHPVSPAPPLPLKESEEVSEGEPPPRIDGLVVFGSWDKTLVNVRRKFHTPETDSW